MPHFSQDFEEIDKLLEKNDKIKKNTYLKLTPSP